MSLKGIKIGDYVNVECWSAQGDDTVKKVTNIGKKYDENTGKPYVVLWCGKRGFSAKSGDALTAPFHYTIIGKVFKKGGKSRPPKG